MSRQNMKLKQAIREAETAKPTPASTHKRRASSRTTPSEAPPAATPDKPAIAPLVREAWSANEGDMPAAASALYGRVVQDQALLGEILPQVLMTWCREQIGSHVGTLRAASLPVLDETGRGGRLRAVIATTLFDFLLPGGKRLGDANAAEILEGSAAYQRSASDAAHKARWLVAVAARVGRRNRADKALTLAELEALFEETRNA